MVYPDCARCSRGCDRLAFRPYVHFCDHHPADNPTFTAFQAARNRVFPNGAYRYVDEGQYVAVKSNATSQQIANELGPNGEIGKFVVFTSGGHWGWHNKDLWEWLTAQGAT